ncbi:MAG: tetratricopeptide repeat protein, partial [bacterium]|nr:tetratricopeptide repeat protein [bacterium]
RFDAQHAIKYNPSDVEVRAFVSDHFKGLSEIYNVNEDKADTIEDLEKLVQLLLAKGHYNKATITMQTLLKKNPNHSGALQFLAQNALEAEDFEAAIRYLLVLKQNKPNDYYLDYNLGLSYLALKQDKEAAAWFIRVYEHTTDDELRREVKGFL